MASRREIREAAVQFLYCADLDDSSELESSNEELEQAVDSLYTVNHVLINFRNNWLQAIDDFPNLKKQLEPFTAQISSLNRVGQRILTVEEPESHPDQTDVSHLRESMKKMGEYRESVAKFVTGVLKNKEQIDASIVKVVENFSPERIDPVDRATIRLASYEILFCDSVPPAVAINEAIEIVKKFGSNESSRFTNGILDALVKNIEKTDINIKISD